MGNHNQPRPVSRWGNDGRGRVHSAKTLATGLYDQQGMPCVYQGEELGMTNTPFARIEDCRGIESINHYRAALRRGQPPEQVMAAIRAEGRDNARTPMPWGARPRAGGHAGFTSGTPWLALNPKFDQINAEQARADVDSVFHHCRQLIQLRRQHAVGVHGRTLPLLSEHLQIAAYLRVWQGKTLLAVCNFSDQARHFEVAGGRRARVGLATAAGQLASRLGRSRCRRKAPCGARRGGRCKSQGGSAFQLHKLGGSACVAEGA